MRWASRAALSLAALTVLVLASLNLRTAAGTAGQGRARATEPAPRPPAPLAPDWTAPHVAGQLLAKLPAGAAVQRGAYLPGAGARVLDIISQLGLALVETPAGKGLAAAATDLAEAGAIEWAEPNYLLQLDLDVNDPYYLPYQSAYLSRLKMPGAWDYTTGRPEVVIAVLDTGVDMVHPDLSAGIWTNSGEIPANGQDDDGNGFVDDVHGWDFAGDDNLPDDDHGHGTHVAGIAAARINNGLGIAGMAGGATIMPVDVFTGGIGTYEDLIRAIIYAADNGARVINMSLGATSYSRGEEAAVDYAWSRGVVLVAAAGNAGRNLYHYPAAHPRVIAVAATDANDNRAGFSTYGDFVDVAAPGVSVYSTYRGGGYTSMSGTSMATPHVSGLAALILSLNGNLTPDGVRAAIENNADDLGNPGWDVYFGYGRINALRALAQVAPAAVPPPAPTPGPPLEIWPSGCHDLITDGDFEDGWGDWMAAGDMSIDSTRVYSGTHAARFAGGPNSRGVLTRTVAFPPFPQAGTLWFAYRIENQDRGAGSSPPFPYDDWLTAELRTADGGLIRSLLRTGNSADTASGSVPLPWDRYLYRLELADLAALWPGGPAALVFTAGNDGDTLPTDFWVDAVRLCVTGSETPPDLPDLAAADLQATGQGCGSGASAVTLQVANQGPASAGNFYVRLAAQGRFAEWHVRELAAGESRSFTWDGVPGTALYTGAVDPASMVAESDETNNQVSRELQVEPTCTPTPTPTPSPTPTPRSIRLFLPLIWSSGTD